MVKGRHMQVASALVAVVLASILSFVGADANAGDGIDSNGYVGGVFGLNVPDLEDSSARGAVGILGGAKIGSEFSVGGYFFQSNKEEENDTGGTFDFNYAMYGLEAAYHFEGEAAGAYLGLRFGMTNVEVGAAKFTPKHVGAMAGYNHWLTDSVSLGGEVGYLAVASSEDVTAGVTQELLSFGILSFLASAKLWF